MPTQTGIYTQEEAAHGHDFSYTLARFISEYLPKHEPVIDLGCGPARYLRHLHDTGFAKLKGVEGTIQNFEYGEVDIHDLTDDTVYYGTGNVISLEVGEHIPEELLSKFLNLITLHVAPGKKLIISWAIPGQDGIGHVSCRHNIWVIHELEKRKFQFLAEDSLRARAVIENNQSYFRNTLMIFKKL